VIDKTVFQTSRDVARSRLPADEASASFGYYIDIPNHWETYRSPAELISWFGIHVTHIAQFPELIQNLGEPSAGELDWAARYVAFFDAASQLLSTTGTRADLRYDIAETLSDWRTITKLQALPARILDFGAGCARQGVSAFLRDPDNIYTAVDSTLAAYTLQNLVLSLIDTMTGRYNTVDFLDYEAAGNAMPRIADARAGSRFHLPVWLIEQHLPERFYDVILASHVLYELSGYDFMRLVRCIDRGLADEGVAYIRGELFAVDPRDFLDTVDLHSNEIVALLRERGIVPIHSEYETFLTTMFAREGSALHRAALGSESGTRLTAARRGRDVALVAGENTIGARLASFAAEHYRVLAVADDGEPFFEQNVRPSLWKMGMSRIVGTDEFVNADAGFEREIREFDADVVILCGQDIVRLEGIAYKILGKEQFPLRFHHYLPIFVLLRDRRLRHHRMFDSLILRPDDVPGADRPLPDKVFPN